MKKILSIAVITTLMGMSALPAMAAPQHQSSPSKPQAHAPHHQVPQYKPQAAPKQHMTQKAPQHKPHQAPNKQMTQKAPPAPQHHAQAPKGKPAPSHAKANQHWRKGQVLSPAYRGQAHWVNTKQHPNLPKAGKNQRWVKVNQDYLLVNTLNHLILSVLNVR